MKRRDPEMEMCLKCGAFILAAVISWGSMIWMVIKVFKL